MLAEVYGKDRATREPTESYGQATENMDAEMIRESITLDTDDDDDLTAQTETNYIKSRSGARPSRKKKRFYVLEKNYVKKEEG